MEWVNAASLRMGELAGSSAVLVEFWDFARANSLRTLPYLREWHRRYGESGLRVIGVHSPEFSFAADRDAVEAAVRRLEIEYPVLVDSDYEVWRAYGNEGWPARYLWDQASVLCHYHFGEGDYADTEEAIQAALLEIDPSLELPEPLEPLHPQDHPGARLRRPSADSFLGSARGAPPAGLRRSRGWEQDRERLRSSRPGDSLALPYEGAGANAVLEPPEGGAGALVEVLLDGEAVPAALHGPDLAVREARTIAALDVARMYALVDGPDHARHELDLVAGESGIGAYALTFNPALA